MGISAFFRSDENKGSVFDKITEEQEQDMAVDLYKIWLTLRKWINFFPKEDWPDVLNELGEIGRKALAKVTMAAMTDNIDNLNIQEFMPEKLKNVIERAKSMINGS